MQISVRKWGPLSRYANHRVYALSRCIFALDELSGGDGARSSTLPTAANRERSWPSSCIEGRMEWRSLAIATATAECISYCASSLFLPFPLLPLVRIFAVRCPGDDEETNLDKRMRNPGSQTNGVKSRSRGVQFPCFVRGVYFACFLNSFSPFFHKLFFRLFDA